MADPVYRPVILFAKGVFGALGLRFVVTGDEHVPRTGGAVLAMNHVGYLDFALAGYAFEPYGRMVRFMAKHEVFAHPVAGPLMRGMKHIPVDREAGLESLHAAVEACRRGEVVGVFPEATISQSFEVKNLKSGAARIATEAGVPLVPMAIWGSQRVLTKGRRDFRTRGTPIRLALGEALHPQPGDDPNDVTAQLKERLTELVAQARRTYPGGPRTPDDTAWLPASMGGSAPTLEQAEAAHAAERDARAARRASRADGRPA